MTNTETATASTPITIGRNGTKVHAATTDGNTFCGSQRRGHRAVNFLPAGTPITCTKCDPAATAAPVTEAPAAMAVCECGARYSVAAGCAMCLDD